MERVATQKPAQRERASAGESMLLDRLAGVDRAGRLESAGAGQKRRDGTLVETEQRGCGAGGRAHRRGRRDSARVTALR